MPVLYNQLPMVKTIPRKYILAWQGGSQIFEIGVGRALSAISCRHKTSLQNAKKSPIKTLSSMIL
jgi:hypothetical protein